MIKGAIHSIETFGSVDGPGIRFIVFLKGCKLRCKYCHNVDTWDPHSDDMRTADEILDFAERYRSYWGEEGGITVSGGEPLLQIDFLIDLFKKAKERGINTCIDTAVQPFTKEEPFFSKFEELMKYTDLLLVDIKHINREEHIELTGLPNDNIKECLPLGVVPPHFRNKQLMEIAVRKVFVESSSVHCSNDFNPIEQMMVGSLCLVLSSSMRQRLPFLYISMTVSTMSSCELPVRIMRPRMNLEFSSKG